MTEEYRVMWLNKDGRWYSHTGTQTTDLSVAKTWREQATHRLWPSGTDAVIEVRSVTPWQRRPSDPVGDEREGER